IHPSFLEGVPNAVGEALACGRPVLVSDVCDHRRLVKQGVTGFLFNPADPSSIADAIWEFSCLSDPKRIEMGKQARGFAERELSDSVCLEHYELLFRKLLSRKHKMMPSFCEEKIT